MDECHIHCFTININRYAELERISYCWIRNGILLKTLFKCEKLFCESFNE